MSKMPGLQTDQPSPEKSAARQAIEKAVVDKGDPSVFTENLHQDGKVGGSIYVHLHEKLSLHICFL